jgi:alpha-1,2-mannosyltransferase
MLFPVRAPVRAPARAPARRAPGPALLGLAALVGITAPLLWMFLVTREPWRMLVDLDVYREAGMSVVIGRPVYDYLTATPQLLPFTYPPVAALFAVPLGLVPLVQLGWVWSVAQLALLAWIVTVAFRPLLERFGRWRPAALGALCGLLFWTQPLKDGLVLGQVNLILVALCLADCVSTRGRWPRGALVGVATALKLTPGVFFVYLWLTGRRRAAATAVGTAAALTVAAFLLLPADSADYWFGALLDPGRLGDNELIANQSLRAAMLRLDWGGDGPLWLVPAAVVAVAGFWWARRCSRAGNELAGCALVGLLAVLLSPVAWIHHLTWALLALAVIVGDGRSRRRLAVGAAALTVLLVQVPALAARMGDPAYQPQLPEPLLRIMQNGYVVLALMLLPVVAWYGLRDAAAADRVPEPEPDQVARAGA